MKHTSKNDKIQIPAGSYYTVSTAAARLGKDPRLVRHWISVGRLRAIEVGPRCQLIRDTEVGRMRRKLQKK